MAKFRNLILSCSSLCWLSVAAATETTVGATYDIAEPDVLDEISARAGQVNWKAELTRDEQSWTGWSSAALPKAERESERHFRPTYTLDVDVPDKTGRVLYPKGFRFNPLEFIQLPGRIVVVGSGEPQASWLKQNARAGDILLTAGGDPRKLGALVQQPVYVLDTRGIERLGVKAVPSIIEQVGSEYRIKEIDIQTRRPNDPDGEVAHGR